MMRLATNSSDAALMRRIQQGDVAAFGALYDRHAPAVFALAARMLRDRAAAEDVTQETFLAVWRRSDGFAADRGALRAWLLTIARNRAVDAIRRGRGHAAQQLGDAADRLVAADCTEDEVLRRADATRVDVALDTLPDTQRQILDLAYFAGLSHSEIATQLRLPLGTVKGRMRLGLHKLAGELGPQAGVLR